MLKKVKNMNGDTLYVYDRTQILKEKALYNLVVGERSNGKTFSVLEQILDNYLSTGKQGALIRRWSEDFKGKRGRQMFQGLVDEGKLNGTRFDGIDYISGQWFLYKIDEDLNKKIYEPTPMCHAFSIAGGEHDKSTSYNEITTILFDEFLTRGAYLPDEFVSFMNILSTIIRYRDDVAIWMCANTVNWDAPYFAEFGIKNVKKMQQGTIDVYNYGDSGCRLAIEYVATVDKKVHRKKSDKYFAFDNPKLSMITGGAWEMAIYPHLPMKYRPKDIRFTYFIEWKEDILQCEIIKVDKVMFTYIHRKTTPIKNEDKDMIFSVKPDPRYNWRRHITRPYDDIGRTIYSFFTQDKVYYQDNEVGEVIRNYLQYCNTISIIRA